MISARDILIYLANSFFDELDEMGSNFEEDLKKYLQHLHLQGLAVSSIARKISAIKSFYRFLSSENIVNTNNASNLEAPKISKKIPDFLTEKEMLKILEFVPIGI